MTQANMTSFLFDAYFELCVKLRDEQQAELHRPTFVIDVGWRVTMQTLSAFIVSGPVAYRDPSADRRKKCRPSTENGSMINTRRQW
jgi:hypothetical protein